MKVCPSPAKCSVITLPVRLEARSNEGRRAAVQDSCNTVSVLTTAVTQRTKWRGLPWRIRFLTAECRVLSEGSPYGICGGSGGMAAGYAGSNSIFLLESLRHSSISISISIPICQPCRAWIHTTAIRSQKTKQEHSNIVIQWVVLLFSFRGTPGSNFVPSSVVEVSVVYSQFLVANICTLFRLRP
jgi:hypothetical protein